MFIGMAEWQEGEEHLIIPTEIGRDHIDTARHVEEDRTVMLTHAARRTARAASVNDARQIIALHRQSGGTYA